MTNFLNTEQLAAIQDHPLSATLPPMAQVEYASLLADIAANGQQQSIVLHDGMILDGRHRARACREAGIACRYVVLPADVNAATFVASANGQRRALTKGQRAVSAAKMVTTTGQGRQAAGAVTQTQAAAQFNVSIRYVRDAAFLLANHAELANLVWLGKRSIGSAMAQVRPPVVRASDPVDAVEVEVAAAPVAAGSVVEVLRALVNGGDYAAFAASLSNADRASLLPAAETFFRLALDAAYESAVRAA